MLSIFTIICINNKMNKNFVIKEETLIYKKLPKSLADYKILQISDLHSKEFGTNNEKLINSIK